MVIKRHRTTERNKVKMVVVIWAKIWYNIGRQMRLQEERFEWREFGEVVDATSRVWYGEKLPRGRIARGVVCV